MSITDELRKAITTLQVKHVHNDHDFTDYYYPSPSQREFTAIADRIDAEYERKVAEMTSSWECWEYTHIALPVDIDNEPVLVGDMLQGMHTNGGWCEPFEVTRISFDAENGWTVYTSGGYGHIPDKCRHYKPSTVEDILEEFAQAWTSWLDYSGPVEDGPTRPIAEYADKLREVMDE